MLHILFTGSSLYILYCIYIYRNELPSVFLWAEAISLMNDQQRYDRFILGPMYKTTPDLFFSFVSLFLIYSSPSSPSSSCSRSLID